MDNNNKLEYLSLADNAIAATDEDLEALEKLLALGGLDVHLGGLNPACSLLFKCLLSVLLLFQCEVRLGRGRSSSPAAARQTGSS